ncbi:MAG: HD domain-containing protein [Pseudomonadota bacterium]|jgi:phosphonate degradation associated HDIG domain protein
MAATVIDRIFELLDRFGALYYGEDATQLQHALQAAELARRNRCSDALIAAALLHDVGHFIDDAGNAAESLGVDANHEIHGSSYLNTYFPREVTEPVRLHVAAKRYLCAIDPAYLKGLSRASAISLELQGGPMTVDEIRAFEAEPFFADAVTLRRFDDMGKHPSWRVPDLASYRPLLESLLVASD